MLPYDQLRVIDTPIPAERQSAKRHYGVHPYFTRRPYNVVRQYIQHYSREGDRVLDPFGGSGVTAIEAFLSNCIGIQNDINPLANFIAKGVADLSKGTLTDYTIALRNVCDRCEQRVLGLDETDDTAISGLLEQLPLPANVRLPANSDVQHYHDLFSPRQLDYRKRTSGFSGKFEVYHDDIDALRDQIKPVDYIFTDPPYGGHISYIDLSILWNAWNGTLPSFKDRQRELIVGGDLNLSEDVYVKRLDQSIRTCFALLKPKHWLSVVFQHWSTAYFDAILTAAAEVGGDLPALCPFHCSAGFDLFLPTRMAWVSG